MPRQVARDSARADASGDASGAGAGQRGSRNNNNNNHANRTARDCDDVTGSLCASLYLCTRVRVRGCCPLHNVLQYSHNTQSALCSALMCPTGPGVPSFARRGESLWVWAWDGGGYYMHRYRFCSSVSANTRHTALEIMLEIGTAEYARRAAESRVRGAARRTEEYARQGSRQITQGVPRHRNQSPPCLSDGSRG